MEALSRLSVHIPILAHQEPAMHLLAQGEDALVLLWDWRQELGI